MARSSSRDSLIDEISSWNVGMPVRPMQELLRRGRAAVAPLVSLVAG